MRHPVAVVCSHLESVDLELVRLDQAGLSEPVADFVPLIALQLQDLAILGVLYHGAVAGELLLASADNFFEVILGGESLNSGECLPPVPLLDPDVH